MKKLILSISLFISSITFACGGGDWEGMDFYNLFMQTNISAEEFYPFLRDEYNHFYGEVYYYDERGTPKVYPKGNITLWKEILKNWSKKDIENAVYKFNKFNWDKYNSAIEKETKQYLTFAQECSNIFSFRAQRNSWDYDKVINDKEINTQELLSKANNLLNKTTNEQVKSRYHYQIIRILHYSKDWSDAINYFENNIENKIVKNEIYYYMVDQVAGCYYSTGNYEKAGYLFTKVLNKSIDRKKSAFNSFSFCTMHEYADGYAENIEDEKDLLLMKSLRNFSNEISNIRKFIKLDANDNRVELLYMRALSNVERVVWDNSSNEKTKKFPDSSSKSNLLSLLKITDLQIDNPKVKNTDFWKLCSSYLFFVYNDIPKAKELLKEVHGFEEQKNVLVILYNVFSWKTISVTNENYINKVLLNNTGKVNRWTDSRFDWRLLMLDKIAHTYFHNDKIAKAFLVHNTLKNTNNLQVISLLNRLEKFYLKSNKSDYEKSLIKINTKKKLNYLDYINYQKGIYYLYNKQPEMALTFFNKNRTYKASKPIPAQVFSNNTKECYECPENDVMDDDVYKAKSFSFIKKSFNRKELTSYLIQLKTITQTGKKWEIKLANYLLGNYYFNISNTGYYRGLLTNNGNCCSYSYIDYDGFSEKDNVVQAAKVIANKERYNLANIALFEKHYFGLSQTAKTYYNKTIELSSNKELNARCLFLIAKCELNDFYNLDKDVDTFEIKYSEYSSLVLPQYKSFKILKRDYRDTNFYDMIIDECSYFDLYCNQ